MVSGFMSILQTCSLPLSRFWCFLYRKYLLLSRLFYAQSESIKHSWSNRKWLLTRFQVNLEMRNHFVRRLFVVAETIQKRGTAIPNRMFSSAKNKQNPHYRSLLNFFNSSSYSIDELEEEICNVDIQEDEVYVILDTTYLHFESIKGKYSKDDPKLGYINKECGVGFGFHAALVVSAATKLPIKVGGFEFLVRPYGQEQSRYDLKSFCDRESAKWIKTLIKTRNRIPLSCRLIVICDREADVYSFINTACRLPNTFVVIRNSQNRKLATGPYKTIYDALENLPPQAHYSFELREKLGHKTRTACMAISYCQATLACPIKERNQPDLYPQQTLYVVRAWEEDGKLEWKIFTNLPINSLEDALKIVDIYKSRWLIEDTFRGMKTMGLNVEASQMETGVALQRLTAISFLVAMRILTLRQGRDVSDPGTLKLHFSKIEQEYLHVIATDVEGLKGHQLNPYPPDSLAWAVWIIARLGCWKPGVKARPPGIITLKRGFVEFQSQIVGYANYKKKVSKH